LREAVRQLGHVDDEVLAMSLERIVAGEGLDDIDWFLGEIAVLMEVGTLDALDARQVVPC